ncbi:Chromosome-partitioning ATPase Soj [subsurface metagenome]
MIDTDTQGQTSSNLGINPELGLAELIKNEVTLEKALITARRGLFLLAGGRKLAEIKNLISRKDIRPEMTLSEALEPYNNKFDFAILDTSPGWDSLSVNVLFYAQEILSPISLEILTIIGFSDFLKSLEPIKKYAEVDINFMLPTFLDGRVKKSDEILQQLRGYYQDKLCSPIRYNVRLSESPGYGQTIFEYSPKSTGAEDYNLLVERVLNGA